MQRHTHNTINNLNRPTYTQAGLDTTDLMEDVISYESEEGQADRNLGIVLEDGLKRLGLRLKSIFIPAHVSTTPTYRVVSLPAVPGGQVFDYRILSDTDGQRLSSVWHEDTENGERIAVPGYKRGHTSLQPL